MHCVSGSVIYMQSITQYKFYGTKMFTRKPGFGLLSMARAWRLMAAILHSNQLAVSIPISYIYKNVLCSQFTHDMNEMNENCV